MRVRYERSDGSSGRRLRRVRANKQGSGKFVDFPKWELLALHMVQLLHTIARLSISSSPGQATQSPAGNA